LTFNSHSKHIKLKTVLRREIIAMTIPEEVDIIICGGGSSGCVPAGRLANLDHKLSVLLIEAGESNLNNPW
jgi:ribulose 1,5-bisphosphate synthetase/thiazole synthase